MAFIHDNYQTILKNNISEIQYNLLDGQIPLANSNIRVQTQALSKVQYLQYCFLDYVALQCCPATATDEYLDYWASLKGLKRKAPNNASGTIIFTGLNGYSVPAGTVLISENGETYTTDTLADVGQTVGITAVNSGSEGNLEANTELSLQSSITGVDSTLISSNAITNGSDIETDTEFRVRILAAFATQTTGDTRAEHINWALSVPGVSQAWVPYSPMAGTECVFYVMLDRTNSHLGYPQGSDGSASLETRYVTAQGDQLTIANALYDAKPYTEIQIICSPQRTDIDFSISGLSAATAALQSSIKDALQNLLHEQGTPLGTSITLASIVSAIEGVAGTTSFTLTSPTTNIVLPVGSLPEVGTCNFI
ncbi:baseplate J/gp47 family protein [Acetobacter persici]|uniref:baseplate J/gp47 family protein n=1 Tax=Acetobacter persici TaxID=1076596 RepID=UPI001BA46368|nr:baseplate J/gp47 family protein [Acetobacter persici]MBS1017252.1 baseplate J/gp47 family protein [Acetobacter persici]MCP9321049.1 baseplate J/gp47 family protein [Acetobacter persici]